MKPYKKKRKRIMREYSGPMKHLPEETSSCNNTQLSIVFKDFDKSHILQHEK